jgi:hypothetical protein
MTSISKRTKQLKKACASSKVENDDLTVGLKEVRAQKRKQKKVPLQEKQPYGEEVASNIFSYILGNK